MAFAIVIIALILLVVLHEAGHFLAARAVRIRATKFYVFFGASLYKKQVGDVEYGIGTIPLGGYVKLPGMFKPSGRDTADRLDHDLRAVLSGMPNSDIRLAASAALSRATRTDDPDAIAAALRDLTTSLDDAIADQTPPIDAWADSPASFYQRRLKQLRARTESIIDDCHPRAYWRAALWRRMVVIAAGPAVNLLIALVVLWASFALHAPRERLDQLTVAKVVANSPADKAGIKKGDEIIRWNGQVQGELLSRLDDQLRPGSTKPAAITYKRDDTTVDKRVTPIVLPAEKGEKPSDTPRVGVVFTGKTSVEHFRQPAGRALNQTLNFMWYTTSQSFQRIPQIFTNAKIRGEVSSVVGIVQTADDVSAADQLISYIGMISLVLAVMNLLPILPLDGGHLLFGVLEALRRGRPVPQRIFAGASWLGIAFVLALFLIGLNNDIGITR